jgi:hypothetical protein
MADFKVFFERDEQKNGKLSIQTHHYIPGKTLHYKLKVRADNAVLVTQNVGGEPGWVIKDREWESYNFVGVNVFFEFINWDSFTVEATEGGTDTTFDVIELTADGVPVVSDWFTGVGKLHAQNTSRFSWPAMSGVVGLVVGGVLALVTIVAMAVAMARKKR